MTTFPLGSTAATRQPFDNIPLKSASLTIRWQCSPSAQSLLAGVFCLFYSFAITSSKALISASRVLGARTLLNTVLISSSFIPKAFLAKRIKSSFLLSEVLSLVLVASTVNCNIGNSLLYLARSLSTRVASMGFPPRALFDRESYAPN